MTRIILVNLFFTLLLLEASLQLINAIGHGNTNPFVRKIYWYIKPHFSWEEWFLVSYMDKGNMIYAGIHQQHPTRGWAMRPSSRFQASLNVTYTTNAQGYRALYDYENKKDKYGIMILGDSFTFGDEITDADTWPNRLQMQSADLNVLNIAGTGYGTDQMLITLEEEIGKYHPDLVIAAFIDDNLLRTMLPFRDYKKPLFLLDNNELRLSNVPVGDPETVIREIARRKYVSYGRIQLINLFGYFFNQLTRMDSAPGCNAACVRMNTAVIDKMQSVSEKNGAEFMLVYLPRGKEIQDMNAGSYGQDFFDRYRHDSGGYFFNPRADFVGATFPKAPEHYHKNETALLSTLVKVQVEKTESWKCKVQKNCVH